MKAKKTLKTLLVTALTLSLLMAMPFIFASAATGTCPDDPSHSGYKYSDYNWKDGDIWYHDVFCEECDMWIEDEPCTIVGGVCDFCKQTCPDPCADYGDHKWTPYENYTWEEDGKSIIGHVRECTICKEIEYGRCTYNPGSSVCNVCGYDSKICFNCKGVGYLLCGDDKDIYCSAFWHSAESDGGNVYGPCNNWVWAHVFSNGSMWGYCGCDRDNPDVETMLDDIARQLESISTGEVGYTEPDADSIIDCSNCGDGSCNCIVDCPDCSGPFSPAPPATTPTAPKTGQDLSYYIWAVAFIVIAMGACFTVILINRKKAKGRDE